MNLLTTPTPELNHLHHQLQWQIFNDNVMGGRSSCAFECQAERLTFSGFVNTNGGGFASIRTKPDPELTRASTDLTHPFIAIELRGDGQRYQLGIQTLSNLNYWIDVDSSTHWQTFRFPLAQLIAKRRGHPVEAAPTLQARDITGFNLMISHGQHGPFTLQVRNLSLYEAPLL